MTQDDSLVQENANSAAPALDWRTKAYIVGGIVGAVVGVGAAYLYVSSAEKQDGAPELHPGEAVGIGLAILAVLRQIAGLGRGEEKKKKRR